MNAPGADEEQDEQENTDNKQLDLCGLRSRRQGTLGGCRGAAAMQVAATSCSHQRATNFGADCS